MTYKMRELGLFIIWALFLFVVRDVYCDECEKESSCSCDCPDGIVDFSSLEGKNGAMYLDQASSDGFLYSYNPCSPFTETDAGAIQSYCQGVAACQVIRQSSTAQYYSLGNQDSVTFASVPAGDVDISDYDGNVVTANYKAADGSRQSQVVLVCNQQDDSTAFAAVGELPQAGTPTYRFVIVSPAACFTPRSISPGSILLIIFFSAAFLYLIAGVIYRRFSAGARGIEQIPNLTLWTSFPGLVRDGIFFIIRRRVYGNV